MLFPLSCVGVGKPSGADSKLHVKALADGGDHIHVHLASKGIHIGILGKAVKAPGGFLQGIHAVGNKVVVLLLVQLFHQIEKGGGNSVLLEIPCIEQHVLLLISHSRCGGTAVFPKDHMMAQLFDSAAVLIGSIFLA